MINSILERHKKKIVIDRLFVKEHGVNKIILDPTEIKSKVAHHFQNIAVPEQPPLPLYGRWTQQYSPLSTIEDKWYENIMQPPTWDEWIGVINSLPNDKAAGPLGIHNEYLKHLGTTT